MASYAFAPQSLIAPLGALDVVWNTLLAPFTLGESLTPGLVSGCALIACGALATSLVGEHKDKKYTIDDMKDLFIRWEVLIYLSILALWVALHLSIPVQRSSAPVGEPWAPGDMIRGLSLGIVAGSIAGNMFCVKAFVELVQLSIADKDSSVWAHWMPYTMFAGAIFFALSNLYFLTKAMKEYEALFMGSIFEGSLIFMASLSGGIVFKEFYTFTIWEALIYGCALAGIILGILIVASGTRRSVDENATQVAVSDIRGRPVVGDHVLTASGQHGTLIADDRSWVPFLVQLLDGSREWLSLERVHKEPMQNEHEFTVSPEEDASLKAADGVWDAVNSVRSPCSSKSTKSINGIQVEVEHQLPLSHGCDGATKGCNGISDGLPVSSVCNGASNGCNGCNGQHALTLPRTLFGQPLDLEKE
jgi:hypothetical protein